MANPGKSKKMHTDNRSNSPNERHESLPFFKKKNVYLSMSLLREMPVATHSLSQSGQSSIGNEIAVTVRQDETAF